VVVRIDSKVTVTLRTAKRMAVAISDIIRRYEAMNGIIEITTTQPTTPKSRMMQ